MNYIKIDNDTSLQACLNNWEQNKKKIIAMDIEAESNLHQYGEKLCLIQIFDGIDRIIIDPLKINQILIKKIFETTQILKLMYDATSDLSLLKNAYDIEIKSILDLRPAVELLDYEKQDLHSIIETDLKIYFYNKKKYQKHNWTRRPLPGDVIEYALNDVIHLFKLKTAIFNKLNKRNLMDEYILKNILIQTKDYKRSIDDKYEKIKGYNRLNKVEKIKARRIYDIRDKYAKNLNMPPNNVLANKMLFNIVKGTAPIHGISFPKRLSKEKIRRILEELKEVMD